MSQFRPARFRLLVPLLLEVAFKNLGTGTGNRNRLRVLVKFVIILANRSRFFPY